MRHVFVITSALLISTASIAFAQSGAPVPLDEQMRRLQKTGAPASTMQHKHMQNQDAAPADATPSTPAHTGEAIDSVGGGAIPSLPIELVTENGVSYLSGGIGDEEIAQIKAQEAQFNIQLTITNDVGDFASNVVVTLKDSGGKTLVTVNDAGPKLLLRVPAGKYTVETSTGGATQKLSVNAPAKGAVKSQIHV